MGDIPDNTLERGISRRTFMAAALATGAASVISSLSAQKALAVETGAPSTNGSYSVPPEPVAESQIVETIDCDIVVVGAGVAGMAGIMYAASKGANVQVLEKGPHEGVHRLCTAGLNPEWIKGIIPNTIDPEEFTTDLYRCSGGFQSKMPIVSRYAKGSGAYIDWLYNAIQPYGWTLLPMPMSQPPEAFNSRALGKYDKWPSYETAYMYQDPDGNSLMTGSSPNWMKLFRQIAEDYGAIFHFDEPGYYLEREDDGAGRVSGIISRHVHSGEYRRYRASKGILLAAGDFYNDKEMVHKYCEHLERCVSSICEPNNTGDMHKAAIWVGAAMDDYSAGDLFGFQNTSCKNWISPRPGEPDYNPGLDLVRGTMWAPALAGFPVLWVDDGGRRFINEGVNNFQQAGAQAILTTPTGKAWSIWDSAWTNKFPEDWATNNPGGFLLSTMSVSTPGQIEREIEEGLIQKYDTIEDMAAGCGFEPEYFKETVNRYNSLCEKGYDEDCYKDPRWLTTIDTPPYYAAHWGAMITSTRCGVKTDERSRVIDTESRIIPGLYAAGNNGGNFYGLNYPGTFGGTGIGHGQFFSYISARDMLGEDVINTEGA